MLTFTLTVLVLEIPSVTDQEHVDAVEADFLKAKDPAALIVLQ